MQNQQAPTVLPGEVERRFAHVARQRRESLGLTQARVAALFGERFGISWRQTTVAKVEAGERPIGLDEAVGLCTVLGMDLGEALSGGPTLTRRQSELLAHQREVDRMRELLDAREQELGAEFLNVGLANREEYGDGQHPEAR